MFLFFFYGFAYPKAFKVIRKKNNDLKFIKWKYVSCVPHCTNSSGTETQIKDTNIQGSYFASVYV